MKNKALSITALLTSIIYLCSCGGGGGGSTGTPATSSSATPQNIAVAVTPTKATLGPNGVQQYSAMITGTSNTDATWSAGGVQGGNPNFGVINSSGFYTAPATLPNPSNVTIRATSVADPSKSGTALARVHDNQIFQNPPIKLGTSGGNKNDQNTSGNKIFCCSGTLGSLLSRGGDLYILSNNHVLDRSDQGAIGDPISQPGLADKN